MQKIMLGITTFNRKEIVEKMSQSFSDAETGNCEIVVFDDCSTEFDKNWLSKVFPTAKIYVKGEKNDRGSNQNLYSIYKYFLNSNADIFFSLDSDLIFDPNFVKVGLKVLEKTDGILSLYNSFKHKPYDSFMCDEGKTLLKKHVGSAGVIFKRHILKKIIDEVPLSRQFDWDWSNLLVDSGIRIMVTDVSYVQHIGFYGYNTDHTFEMDFGYNFKSQTEVNNMILFELLETCIVEGNCALIDKLKDLDKIRNTLSWRITAPLRFIGKFIDDLLVNVSSRK